MQEKNLPSKKQRELLSFIDGFIKGNGYGPSYREIMRALDYRSVSTVAVHVDGLIAKGYLNKGDNSARSLEITTRQDGGKSADKANANSHEKWLVSMIDQRIKAYEAEPSVHKKANIQLLIDALPVLELHEAHANLVKQLDQTAQ